MQWILQDESIGGNIQNIRIERNMTQLLRKQSELV